MVKQSRLLCVCEHECDEKNMWDASARQHWDGLEGIRRAADSATPGVVMLPSQLQLWWISATAVRKWHESLEWSANVKKKRFDVENPANCNTHTHIAEVYSPPLLLQSNQLVSNPIRPTEAFHLESSGGVDYARGWKGNGSNQCVCVCECTSSKQACVCVCVHVFVHVCTSAHLHCRRLCGSARLCRLRCTSSVSSVILAAVRRCRSHRSGLWNTSTAVLRQATPLCFTSARRTHRTLES